jgi:hypothetical protein
MTYTDNAPEAPISLLKVCVGCMITRLVGDFPSREGGKKRARCTPCFRQYANSKRRKEKETKDIADLPVTIAFVSGGLESFVDVVAQILTDEKFLVIPETDLSDEPIDLKALLKTDANIDKLVEKEIENEKDRYLSTCLDGRTSQG